jgi:hypothetical protein
VGFFILPTYLSNMKIIINEYHVGLLRRVGMIEDLIYPTMDLTYDYIQGGDKSRPIEKKYYPSFESTVAMKLANQLANETSLDDDEYVTLRNQLLRFITNEYRTKMREYFFDRSKIDKQ